MINQQLSLRIPKPLFEKSLKKSKLYGFTSVQEYIKDVLRQDLYIPERVYLTKKQKEKMLKSLDKMYGSSKLRTSDEHLHEAREKIADELEKELGLK